MKEQGQSARRGPSIRDVAARARVSHQTVSRVLNDFDGIRPQTKERVMAAMTELGYRRNQAARALVTNRSGALGLLSTEGHEYGPISSTQAIERAARDRGFVVNQTTVDSTDPASIRAGVEHLRMHGVEGLLIVAPQRHVVEHVRSLAMEIPFVVLQAVVTPEPQDGVLSLYVDQVAGARLATRHLIERGHTRILHLAGPQGWVDAEARVSGYQEEMRANGLEPLDTLWGDWSADRGYWLGRELAQRQLQFSAIFSANDQMALGLLHAFHSRGLSTPADVSIVGFDDIPEARHFWPPLTSVRQDFRELGRRAIDALLGSIAGDELRLEPLAPQLVVRESTRVLG
ncbi:substrate-binding domain-containing protein [Lysinibacter cavernae]|uniref:DNA-binding LacI/PurR family transcriptional regulator n=1 Tax=Lysinibacter cavernae TaxID=1640652 RepID=A0A7X5QYP6_9MICO|nr:DNA-binding LacI/PurR family transcriptional regulator [Lysinibacter cavernae]